MIYGYARVSTRGQMTGNSLEEQKERLMSAGCEEIFYEAYTGTKKDRPELNKVMSLLSEGDTLIVTKLDRLARSIKFGAEIIENLADRGVTINILNLGVIDNTPSGKLMRNIFLAFAEFERDMIVERTTEGKRIAKQDPNFTEGRPRIQRRNMDKYVEMYHNGEITGCEAAKKMGISPATFSRRAKNT